jgi:hypothetical protein
LQALLVHLPTSKHLHLLALGPNLRVPRLFVLRLGEVEVVVVVVAQALLFQLLLALAGVVALMFFDIFLPVI